jgi:hypothetical protein
MSSSRSRIRELVWNPEARKVWEAAAKARKATKKAAAARRREQAERGRKARARAAEKAREARKATERARKATEKAQRATARARAQMALIKPKRRWGATFTPGQVCGNWTILEYAGKRGNRRENQWLCRCRCGAEGIKRSSQLSRSPKKCSHCPRDRRVPAQQARVPAHQSSRNHRDRARKYGLPPEVLTLMYEMEKKCAICGRAFAGRVRRVVDQCHRTQRVRNLLCGHCNTLIGMANENTAILKSAAAYVQRHNLITALGYPQKGN